MKPAARLPLYLTLEDEDGFEEGLPEAIVPVVFTKTRRRLEGECYFGAYPVLRRFLTDYADNPFSRQALDALNKALLPYLDEIGYERAGGVYRYYRSFVLWDKRKLNADCILPGTSLLTPSLLRKVKTNRTDFDLGWLLEKKLETAVILSPSGELLSLCSVNEHHPEQQLLELTVYTLPAARKRGFAASCAALLTKTLLESKRGVVYVCSCHNAASIAVAKRIGLQSESRFYAVDAYKK